MLITISREFGAGGSQVAHRVAEALGWRLVDREFSEEIARRVGVSEEEVTEREEKPSSFIERLAQVTALESPEMFLPTADALEEQGEGHFVKVTRELVEELAADGRCVLVGRASAAVLAQSEHTLHARIVAPREFRLQRAIKNLGVSADEAEEILEEKDEDRIGYHREYYHRDCTDSCHYDMVLNTERLGIEGAAAVIVDRAKALGWS